MKDMLVVKHRAGARKGQAAISIVFLFLVGSFIVIGGISFPILKELQAVNELLQSKQAFYLSEAGMEDVVYRIITGGIYFSPETLMLNGSMVTTTVTNILDGRDVVSKGSRRDRIRKTRMRLIEGTGVSFFYGMQSDTGGIFMENNSSIIGNLYSNGSIIGETLNDVIGVAVSAGPSGLIDNIHATGSAFANTIQNAKIDIDAYYQSIFSTIVLGAEYPGSPDQAPTSLPITDAQIDEWKADAEAGGIISFPCPYEIDTDMTIGPVKIECDLIIDKSQTNLTLRGAVWVEGSITTKSGPTILVDPSLAGKSIPFIADNPGDRTTSSQIFIQNSALFQGAGEDSYILMISQNSDAENGGSEVAITAGNNAGGDLLVYAAHGEILLKNNISLKEVSGYRIHLQNFAKVIYETGLASLLFTTGPGGGYVVDGWWEIE